MDSDEGEKEKKGKLWKRKTKKITGRTSERYGREGQGKDTEKTMESYGRGARRKATSWQWVRYKSRR